MAKQNPNNLCLLSSTPRPRPMRRWQRSSSGTKQRMRSSSAPSACSSRTRRATSRPTSCPRGRPGRALSSSVWLDPLSGGMTVVGGVIFGAIVGSLFHKGLGLSKDDLARISTSLDGGKAGVALVVNADEAEAVSAKLVELDGTPETHEVTDEAVEEAAAAAEAAPEAEALLLLPTLLPELKRLPRRPIGRTAAGV